MSEQSDCESLCTVYTHGFTYHASSATFNWSAYTKPSRIDGLSSGSDEQAARSTRARVALARRSMAVERLLASSCLVDTGMVI